MVLQHPPFGKKKKDCRNSVVIMYGAMLMEIIEKTSIRFFLMEPLTSFHYFMAPCPTGMR